MKDLAAGFTQIWLETGDGLGTRVGIPGIYTGSVDVT